MLRHHGAVAQTLLQEAGADPNAVDDLGNSPLYLLASEEDGVNDEAANLAGLLLSRGASPRLRGPMGVSPLHAAARTGKLELVYLLVLTYGVGFDRDVDFYGQTPVFSAAANGHDDVLEFLLRRSR